MDCSQLARVLFYMDEGGLWWARHIALIEHDLDMDHMVYRCDTPLAGPCDTLTEVALLAASRNMLENK